MKQGYVVGMRQTTKQKPAMLHLLQTFSAESSLKVFLDSEGRLQCCRADLGLLSMNVVEADSKTKIAMFYSLQTLLRRLTGNLSRQPRSDEVGFRQKKQA